MIVAPMASFNIPESPTLRPGATLNCEQKKSFSLDLMIYSLDYFLERFVVSYEFSSPWGYRQTRPSMTGA